MSTIKSSSEHLTLNADGANNDVIIQSNGSTKVTVDGQNSRVGIGTATPAYTLSVSGGSVNIEDGYAYGFGDNSYRIEGKDDGATTARIGFVTGGSEIARFTADGLTFNGDTATANALDDYEEGTWTPTDASAAGLTINVNHASYTKVGNRVHISFYINYPSTSNTDSARITLPFSGSGASYEGSILNYAGTTLTSAALVRSNGNTSEAVFMLDSNVGITNATLSGSSLFGTFTYKTDS